MQFETQFQNDSIPLADKTKIDSILTSRLSDFPKVEPAIKRGVKVKTQFVLPVIIKMEKISKGKINYKFKNQILNIKEMLSA